MKTIICALFAILQATAFNALAAEITYIPDKFIIAIQGEIKPGDAKKLITQIPNDQRVIGVALDSAGGDIYEALVIGEIIYNLRLSTVVPTEGKCASACFFIWMNGRERIARAENYRIPIFGPIGLHRPYLSLLSNDLDSTSRQRSLMVNVADYLRKRMIPQRLIDLMMSKPSSDIYWLTEQDLKELGKMPPELDELYINKCGARLSDLLNSIIEETSSGNKKTSDMYVDKANKQGECEINLDQEARTASLTRLKHGWIPNPF